MDGSLNSVKFRLFEILFLSSWKTEKSAGRSTLVSNENISNVRDNLELRTNIKRHFSTIRILRQCYAKKQIIFYPVEIN